jgi:hypothetical protein
MDKPQRLRRHPLRFLPYGKIEWRLKVRGQRLFSTLGAVGLPQMSMLPNVSVNRRLSEQVSTALVYLGIVTTFAVASLIICAIWLLIW